AWGVYRLSASVASWHQAALAMCLQAAPHAALSHRSAAHVWQLDGFDRKEPQPIEILVPQTRRLKTWAHVRRTHHFEPGIPRSMPVTPLSRTVVDLAAVLGDTELEVLLHSALRFGPRALHSITQRLEKMPPRAWRGLSRLRELMQAYDGTLDSALEVLVKKL